MNLSKRSEECKKIIRRSFSNYKSKEEKFAEFMNPYLRKECCVLDAGCGKGSKIDFINYVKLAVGIDKIEENLREDYKVHTRIVADLEERIPFPDSTFDIVVCEMVLEHLKNPLIFFKELSRVLKEKGAFILMTPNIFSFWIISKLTPFKLHQFLNKKLHNINDTFPTYYRANTVLKLNSMLKSAGLLNESTIMFQNKPSMLTFSKFLTRLDLIYAKILRKYRWLQPIRDTIIASYRKYRGDILKPEERETILRNYGQVGFEDLLKTRLSFTRLPKNLYAQYLEHELRGLKRGEESLRKIEFMLGSAGRFLQRKDNCLELGCGMGGGFIVLSKIYKTVVGLDISEIDLLLAKKRLEENGIKNVKLVCGSTQNLPFKEEVFDLASATDVIEHMANQEIFLKEAHRTLRNGGYFYFNSPNRFNIFGPEPHVRVWGVGFLPRRYMPRFVKAIKGVDYKSKRLLSYFELSRLLRKNYGGNYRIFGMTADNSKIDKSLKRKIAYKFPWIIKLLNFGLKPLITQYHVIVFKK